MNVESEAHPQVNAERDGGRPVPEVPGTARLAQILAAMLSDS